MPKSLRCKLSDLRYKRLITDEEYQEMIKKLNGHDREIRNKAIDDFAEALKKEYENAVSIPNMEKETAYFVINEIAKKMKGEK